MMGMRAKKRTRMVSLILSLVMLLGLCEPSAFQALIDEVEAGSGYSFVFGSGSSSVSVGYGGYATGNISGLLPEHQGIPIMEVTISREANMLLEPENGRDKFKEKTGSMQYGEGSTDRGGTSFMMFSPYMWREMQDQVNENPGKTIGIAWYEDSTSGNDSLKIKDISAMGGRMVEKKEVSGVPYAYEHGIFYDFILKTIADKRGITLDAIKADLGSIKQSEIMEVVAGVGKTPENYNWKTWVDLSKQGANSYYESAIYAWSYILQNTAGVESASSAGYSNPRVDYGELGGRLEGFLGLDENYSKYPKLKAAGGTNGLQKWYDDPTASAEHVMYRLKMLDLLLSCYIIIGGKEVEMRAYFDSIGNQAGYATLLGTERMEQAVNDWLKNENLDKAPIGINISTWEPAIIGDGVQFPINSTIEPHNSRTACNIVLTRTTTWMDFAYQVPKEYRFNLTQGTGGWAYPDFVGLKDGSQPLGTHKRYLWVINKTAARYYNERAKIAPAATWDETNAFSWARSLISYGGIEGTLSGNAYCRTSKSKWGYLSFLAPFDDKLQITSDGSPGVFGNVYMAMANPPLTANELVIELDAHFEDMTTTKVLSGDGPELGEPVYLEVRGAKDVDLNKMWQPFLNSDQITSYNVWFEFRRYPHPKSPGGVPDATSSSDYANAPYYIKKGSTVTKGTWANGPGGEMAAFVSPARAPRPVTDQGAATQILIPEEQMRAWVYEAQMFVEYTSGGKTFQIKSNVASCNVGAEIGEKVEGDNITGGNPADETNPVQVTREKKPEVRRWNSAPKTYSELKEGTVGNETFEAMAGVPSTETLYFASGGSEFIVDIEAVRIEGATSERQYRTYFDQVDCEYKEPDTAKPQTLGGVSVQLHEGGHYIAAQTWTGTCPYTYSFSGCNQSITQSWDDGPYNEAVAEATEYAKEINDTVLSYTCRSDGLTREHKGWGAHVVTVSHPHPAGSSGSHQYGGDPPAHTGDSPGSPGSEGSFFVRVEFDVPQDIICGPCCHHILPMVEDTWKQKIRFDYMKITDLHVWKIDQSAVDGMAIITDAGDEIVQAKIVKGEPNVFYNIAETETSKDGRLRYNLEAQQHDSVVWHETGVNSGNQRTNKCNGVVSHRRNEEPVADNGHDNPWGVGILYSNGNNPTRSDNNPYNKPWCHDYIDDLKDSNNLSVNAPKPDGIDSATPEYRRFMERRNYTVQARVISDMLILQTSSGDQSILYYDKASTVVPCDQNFNNFDSDGEDNRVISEIEKLWDRNNNCAGLGFVEGVTQGRDAVEWINYGSYNGKYNQPSQKYKANGNRAQIQTAFDSNGSLWDATTSANAKPNQTVVAPLNYRSSAIREVGGNVTASPTDEQKRLDRPRSELKLYKDRIVQNVTNPNQEYITGDAEVYWKNIVDYHTTNYKKYGSRNNTTDALYDTSYKRLYTGTGYVQESPYSPEHNKINDIVVQDPVSVEDAYVVGLPDERDQRATLPNGVAEYTNQNTNKNTTCPGDPAGCEFRILNCKYYQDQVVGSFNMEDGLINAVGAGKTYAVTAGFNTSAGKLVATSGRRIQIPFTDLSLSYSPGTRLRVNFDYTLAGGNSTMIASFQNIGVYLENGKISIMRRENNTNKVLAYANRTMSGSHRLEIIFDMNNVSGFQVKLDGSTVGMTITTPNNNFSTNDYGGTFNIGCWGATNDYYATFQMDNLVITRLAGTKYHTDACYESVTYHPSGNNTHVHNRDCLHATNESAGGGGTAGTKKDYSYTGGYQTFTAPSSGTYKLEVWGAQGGTSGSYTGGLGGYSYGEVDLKKGETLYIAVGAQGSTGTGGWNGGGNAVSYSGGGGATDIRKGSTSQSARIIVAGGGGGAAHTGNGGNGGGTSGGNGIGGNGGTQYSGYSLGQGGTAARHGGGGGGGWYGGYGGSSGNCNASGGGGSGYIGGVRNGSTAAGKQSGNGKASITLVKATNAGLTGLDAVIEAMNGGGGGEVQTNTVTFQGGYTGSIKNVNLAPGNYKIEAWGAQGGNAYGTTGGKGAYSVSYITVDSTASYKVLVGQQGGTGKNDGNWSGSGGGGGTFIATSSNSPVCVAGGGGGSGGAENGKPGVSTQDTGANHNGIGQGGTGGLCGNGAGFYGNGSAATNGWGTGGNSFVSGGAAQTGSMSSGNPFGGFGGGGSSHGNSGGGAGGGGYTGGRGCSQDNYSGWGGGSYYTGPNSKAISGNSSMPAPNGGNQTGQSGNGYAKITQLTAISGGGGGNSNPDGVAKGTPINFSATGSTKQVTLPAGQYKFEAWGAQGGTNGGDKYNNNGAYVTTTVTLDSQQTVYVNVGRKGQNATTSIDQVDGRVYAGGWNGGAYGSGSAGSGGGGATDFRLGSNSVPSTGTWSNLIAIAGGGGGAGNTSYDSWGRGNISSNTSGVHLNGVAGDTARHNSNYENDEGGGGGGYWGGASPCGDDTRSGYGGTSYIQMGSGSIIAGNTSMPNPSGGSMTGRAGDGYARITPLSVKGNGTLTEDQLKEIFGNDVWNQIKNQATSGGGSGTFGESRSFSYRGNYESFTAPVTGTYKLEVWGAQGGTGGQNSGGVSGIGGKGGYAVGEYNLTAGQTVYVYVGGRGADSALKNNGYVSSDWTGGTYTNAGGWNGGGTSYNFGAGGGGATDIRTVTGSWNNLNSLNSRIIVAGGGGGAQARNGGDGGGLEGKPGQAGCGHVGQGGTQTQGGVGAIGYNTGSGVSGGFGYGGTGRDGNGSTDNQYGAGGGGGWYGGGSSSSDTSNTDDSGGGGGSSYIARVSKGSTTAGLRSGYGMAKISWSDAGSYDADKIWDIVVRNINKIPAKLPDGTPNPILVCGDVIANGSAIGTMTEASYGGGTSKVTSKVGTRDVDYIKLNRNTTGSVTLNSVKTAPGEYYVVLFDVKSTASMCDFQASFAGRTQTLRANRGTETKKMTILVNGNPSTLRFTGGGANMPGDVTITNIHVYKKSDYFNKHVCDAACYTKKELQCSEPHHRNVHYGVDSQVCWEACMDDAKHRNYIPKDHVDLVNGEEIHPGEFLNLDYGFRVYYPNTGDFLDTLCYGIAATTTERGKGYVNNMDTTKWTREKRIQFDFAVLYERFPGQWEQYRAGEAINLTVTGWSYPYYNFYVLLANNEHVSAPIQYEVEAINCAPANHKGDGGIDASKENKVYPYFSDGISNHGEAPTLTNRQRFGDLTALHSAWKMNVIDVVGRIGNLTASDTDDYRFSNFFKVPLASDDWIVEGIVKQVNPNVQNNFYGDRYDVRGEPVGVGTHWLNTYGVQEWKEESPVTFPIQGAKNNIMVLQKEQMRPGYNVYLDIATLGDYSKGELQVFPYFYVLDVHSGEIIPVDVYMNDNGEFSAVNIFGMADEDKGGNPEVDPTEEFRYAVTLDWAEEAGRRNYTEAEVRVTQEVANHIGKPVYGYYTDLFGEQIYGIVGYDPAETPSGTNYTEGDMQMLVVEDRGKTYLGTSDTYGSEINIWGKEHEVSFAKQGQRWHFKLGIPSSSVFVRYDGVNHQVPDVNNTNEFYDPMGENYAVLMCAEIFVRGETYILRAGYPDKNNGYIDFGDKRIKLPMSIPRCIAVMNSTYTATDDVDIVKTH